MEIIYMVGLCCKTSLFNEDFIGNYNEESDEGYFLEVDVQHHKKLHELHNHVPLLPERLKIKKVGKLVANLHDTASIK